VSCCESGSRSVGGFARSDREFTNGEIDAITHVMTQLHEKAAPPASLTPAQQHALRLVAEGHRYAETADRLRISQSALKARLKAARQRLKARTTAEAIQRAQVSKLL
jgi:LuxR family transcriptional regulator